MLSRTANNLYWLTRYMERMDYVARLLEVGQRMAGLSRGGEEWRSALIAAGCEPGFHKKHETVTTAAVIDFLFRDPDNPSSIQSCITTARQNARAVRTAITTDMWEALNGTWQESRELFGSDFRPGDLNRATDWVKTRAVLFRGAYASTMLRSEAYWFARLGSHIERADNTARILDVKYHVLLPDYEAVGGGLDYHHWTSILRAVSALRAYHWVYRDRVKPWNVAELMILRPEMPRSLRACYDEITSNLDLLGATYGGRYGECHRLAGELHARLRFGRIDNIFQTGLHEFLTEYIDRTLELGDEISTFFLF